jgi:hypothetical protein
VDKSKSDENVSSKFKFRIKISMYLHSRNEKLKFGCQF